MMALPNIHTRLSAHLLEQRLGTHPVYVCPACKDPLGVIDHGLRCETCTVTYPLRDGMPDFAREDLSGNHQPIDRWIPPLVDAIAGIYETPLWYTPILRIYGGPGAPDFHGLIDIMRRTMHFPEAGIFLDAACGPCTWGRRIATGSRTVYGIDLSWPMLRKGSAYLAEGNISGVHLAHSRVEVLPFPDALFDGAVCGGALHLFSDTVAALTEIGRTMKPRAELVVITFTSGNRGLLRLKWLREHVRKDHGLHIFELKQLGDDLAKAGFDHFSPQVYGSLLVFSARRAG